MLQSRTVVFCDKGCTFQGIASYLRVGLTACSFGVYFYLIFPITPPFAVANTKLAL